MIGAIGGISGYSSYGYQPISYNSINNGAVAGITNPLQKNTDANTAFGKTSGIDNPLAKVTGKEECQSCKNRKYVDGSDEMVSFKSPAKIDANSSYARVSAHEQEHVNNAYNKAEKEGGKVLQASVAIKRAICPECGKSYIAGGTTTTRIMYPKDNNNPYSKNQQAQDSAAFAGRNFNSAV